MILVIVLLVFIVHSDCLPSRKLPASVICFRHLFMAVNIPDMSSLQDIKSDSIYIKKSIINWLNQEFIDQECHYKIGSIVEDSYLNVRSKGITDPGELLMQVGSDLELNSKEFDKAFVGPWDVANKVSDLVFRMLNIELCSCDITASISSSTDRSLYTEKSLTSNIYTTPRVTLPSNVFISSVKLDPIEYKEIEEESESTFYRYNILRQFMEAVPSSSTTITTITPNACVDEFIFPNDIGWSHIQVFIGLCLGFRIVNDYNGIEILQQIQNLTPYNYENLIGIPDFTDTTLSSQERLNFEELICNDFPNDEESLDIVIEQLIGFEIYQLIKKSQNQEAKLRVLVVKWLYVHGILQSNFPPKKERFIPAHMKDDFDYN